MGSRRKSRELAMQALFYMDMRRQSSEEMLDQFHSTFVTTKKLPSFLRQLVAGVISEGREIDDIIVRFSSNWKMNRMSCVDRNVMRIAVYEMLFREDIPIKVSINEAIDVGKTYGTGESGAFINGILDSIRLAMESNEIRVGSGHK